MCTLLYLFLMGGFFFFSAVLRPRSQRGCALGSSSRCVTWRRRHSLSHTLTSRPPGRRRGGEYVTASSFLLPLFSLPLPPSPSWRRLNPPKRGGRGRSLSLRETERGERRRGGGLLAVHAAGEEMGGGGGGSSMVAGGGDGAKSAARGGGGGRFHKRNGGNGILSCGSFQSIVVATFSFASLFALSPTLSCKGPGEQQCCP